MGWGWGGGHLDPHRWLLCLWFLWKSKPPMKWPPPIKKKENIEATNEKKWLKCPHTHTLTTSLSIKIIIVKCFVCVCVCVWVGVCSRFSFGLIQFFLGAFFLLSSVFLFFINIIFSGSFHRFFFFVNVAIGRRSGRLFFFYTREEESNWIKEKKWDRNGIGVEIRLPFWIFGE